MAFDQRIRIETGSKTPQPGGGTKWATTSSTVLWAEAITVSAEARPRYQSIDGVLSYLFRFRARPTITMKGSRFVWVTDGHPNHHKIYYPAAPSENIDGQGRFTSILVADSGEVASA